MKTAMKTLFTTIALSMSALVATSAMAAPQHDPRFAPKHPPAHLDHKKVQKWNDQRDNKRFNNRAVNPSRDWRVGQTFPRQYDSRGYKVSDRDARRLPNTGRYQQWYKVNGDYVLVNERTNRIIRIIN